MYYPRESERDYLYTKKYGLVVFALLFLIFALMAKNEAIPPAAIKFNPQETIGKVTAIDPVPYRSNAKTIYYDFEDNNGNKWSSAFECKNDCSSADQKYKEGMNVTVIYSGLFPQYSTSKVTYESGSISFNIFVVSSFLFLCALGLIFKTIVDIFRHKEEDRYY